jgi:hypothetical protein
MKILNLNVAPACGFVLALLLLGCANTTMTARVNPETTGRQIARVMVRVEYASLDQRHTAEDALCSELAKVSVWTCLTYSKVFFIGETYTPEQVQQRMQRSDIDTVLLLKPTDSGTTSTGLGTTTAPNVGLALLEHLLSDASTKPIQEASSLDKIWANYEVKLISVSDDRVIWYASANTNGTVFANWKDLIASTARQTVRQLAQSGLLSAK